MMPFGSPRQLSACVLRSECAVSVVLALAVTASLTSCAHEDFPLSESPPESKETFEAEQLFTENTTTLKQKHMSTDQSYTNAREEMVAKQLAARDIVDQRVLDAMKRIPRHEFVAEAIRPRAYHDSPLPIGHEQTISQPYIVALMTQLVEPRPHEKALDIGTGSGYQAAVLSEIVKEVYSIEIVEPLAQEARDRLRRLRYKNVTVRHGDGYQGWKSEAPFDIIIVAAAPDHVPQPLVDQLAPTGKMVIPVGKYFQELLVIEKLQDGNVVQRNVTPVAFVPMTGEATAR